jgi:hypothetical protein
MLKSILVVILFLQYVAWAETPNPRFGKWRLKSTAPAPTSNIMSYEPSGKHGMKITIDAVNKDGVKSQWFYTTRFDGKDEPITGNPGADTGSVKVINAAINEIIYKKDGKIAQVLTNVLSPDGDTIGIIYEWMSPARLRTSPSRPTSASSSGVFDIQCGYV